MLHKFRIYPTPLASASIADAFHSRRLQNNNSQVAVEVQYSLSGQKLSSICVRAY